MRITMTPSLKPKRGSPSLVNRKLAGLMADREKGREAIISFSSLTRITSRRRRSRSSPRNLDIDSRPVISPRVHLFEALSVSAEWKRSRRTLPRVWTRFCPRFCRENAPIKINVAGARIKPRFAGNSSRRTHLWRKLVRLRKTRREELRLYFHKEKYESSGEGGRERE